MARRLLFVLFYLLSTPLLLAQTDESPTFVLVDHGRVLSLEDARSAGYFERKGRWLPRSWKKKVRSWDRLDRKHGDWSEARKTRSDHYRIVTNLPAHLVDTEIAPFLDELYEAYARFFRDEFGLSAKAADNKFIYIHKSLGDYAANTGGRSIEAARYNPGFIRGGSELVVYHDESDQEVFYNTVMHESAHQFVQAIFPGAVFPIWIDEGLATYFEGCRYSRSRRSFEIGEVPAARLLSARRSLAERPDAAMAELFLDVPRLRFGAREYALAWSFIHFLNHGQEGRWRRSFTKFLKEMNGAGLRRTPSEIFEQISGRGFADLEADWKEHLRGLQGEQRYWVVEVEGEAESLRPFGLVPGDIVTHLDGEAVANADHFAELWRAPAADRSVSMVVRRRDGEGRVRLGLRLDRASAAAPVVRNRRSRDGSLID